MELYSELLAAYNRISPYIHRTPVLHSNLINEMVGADVFFKCENFQKGGSYKIRGALNATLQLTPDQLKKGIITHSSGNFAQAVALAAKSLEIPSYIVMPSTAPSVKVAAVKAYGGQVTICGPTLADREKTAKEVMEKT